MYKYINLELNKQLSQAGGKGWGESVFSFCGCHEEVVCARHGYAGLAWMPRHVEKLLVEVNGVDTDLIATSRDRVGGYVAGTKWNQVGFS